MRNITMSLRNVLKNNSVSNGIFQMVTQVQAGKLLRCRHQWKQIQYERLAAILTYAKNHSRYFHDIIGDHLVTVETAESVLKKMPLLTKDIIREKQFDIYSDETGIDWKVWGNTGGSTGEPLRFPRKNTGYHNEGLCQWIIYNYLNRDKSVSVGDIIMSISGERVPEEKKKKNIFWVEGGNFPWGKFKYSTLDMTDHNLPYYVQHFLKVKPSFIRGYSAGVLTFAQYIEKHQIAINFKIKGIYLTSEAFSESSRQYISKVFNCPVIGQYGHTEMSVFAIQHIDDTIYECLPLYGYTEILDENGKQVKIGETGEIVVTGFNQIGLPFIRYKTGDLATYRGIKEDGSVLIDAIQGRTVDFLYDRKKEKVFLTGAIFGGHIKAFNHIAQWQLVQDEVGIVTVYIIKGQSYDETIEKEVINFFEGFNIEARIEYVNEIKKQKNGKQKFLIQTVNL